MTVTCIPYLLASKGTYDIIGSVMSPATPSQVWTALRHCKYCFFSRVNFGSKQASFSKLTHSLNLLSAFAVEGERAHQSWYFDALNISSHFLWWTRPLGIFIKFKFERVYWWKVCHKAQSQSWSKTLQRFSMALVFCTKFFRALAARLFWRIELKTSNMTAPKLGTTAHQPLFSTTLLGIFDFLSPFLFFFFWHLLIYFFKPTVFVCLWTLSPPPPQKKKITQDSTKHLCFVHQVFLGGKSAFVYIAGTLRVAQ